MELFYEPYLYDLELFLFSTDASNVRAHMYKERSNKVDWTMYKGAKRLFVELEPGEYEVSIVMKLPLYPEQTELSPKQIAFQLQLVSHQRIDRQSIMPATLNYYGMLGPEGKDFGQVVYYCEQCILENLEYKTMDFFVKDGDVNFDAVISTPDDKIDLVLEQVASEIQTSSLKKDYDHAFK